MKPTLLQHPLSRPAAKRIVARGARADAFGPKVTNARYDAAADQLVVDLRGGYAIAIPRRALANPLRGAGAEELDKVHVEGGGSVLFWPALDEGFDVTELLARVLTPRVAAATLGRRGGASKSRAKAASARANGALGGRPRAVAARASRS